MQPLETVHRFDDRVDDYARYRPGYPPGLVDWLYAHGLDATARVADIGAGTGISSRLFVTRGHPVCAVEPNARMRAAAQAASDGQAGFTSVDGRAEATTLPDAAFDLVSVAQAFHWFDREAVKREWRRILVRAGFVAVFWNARRVDESAFTRAYESLLERHAIDRSRVESLRPDDGAMAAWFGPGLVAQAVLDNPQHLDLASLSGRLLSSSTAPAAGHADRQPMLDELAALFADHAADGQVRLTLETHVHFGRLGT